MSGNSSQSCRTQVQQQNSGKQASPLQALVTSSNTLLAAAIIPDQAVIHINHVRGLITVLQPINSNNNTPACNPPSLQAYVIPSNTLLAAGNILDQAVINIHHVRGLVTVLQIIKSYSKTQARNQAGGDPS
jgi:hypothetical protein